MIINRFKAGLVQQAAVLEAARTSIVSPNLYFISYCLMMRASRQRSGRARTETDREARSGGPPRSVYAGRRAVSAWTTAFTTTSVGDCLGGLHA